MATILIPSPARDGSSSITWPDGEPQPVRKAFDVMAEHARCRESAPPSPNGLLHP